MEKNVTAERENISKEVFYTGFVIVSLETKRANFKDNTDNQKFKTLMLTVATQNLSDFMFYENNYIILKYVPKQIQAPHNLLLLFGSTRDAPVKS